MDEEEIDKVVLAYLDKRGFKQAGLAFQQEKQQTSKGSNASSTAQIDPDIAKQILSFSEVDGPAQYQEGYSKLRSWAYSSLDQYQHELVRVLYPVFIHAFMDLVAKGHIQEGNGICTFSKAEQISPGQPSSIADDAEYVTFFGSDQDAANLINQKEIHWGLLEYSLEERLEKMGAPNVDSEKADGEAREGELEENKKRSVDGGKQGTTPKKLKKDKVVGATTKAHRPESVAASGAPRVKPELALPVIPVEVEQSILEDLRNRVQLSSMALPSISFYTFINTHDSLNCASISHDGSMVAGGFSDSSLKVWDMAKLGQQSVTYIEKFDLYTLVFMILGTLLGENELFSSEPSSSAGGRCYTLFRGHAGPVHSATFSPFGDFILSSSSDSTIRLWSTKLNANLVCYKGHNYPVWDVQFSPMGHYFASASHDRTARIWSMDRIQPLRIMAGHLSDVDCVQWHANCNYIATGSSDKTVRLWDVQSGECVRIFIGHRSMILSLAMSPDGRYMASGDEDGTIMMWDLASGRCVSPLVGHGSCIWSLAFSCEGSLLASGSADCTVKIWDVATSSKVPKADENSPEGIFYLLLVLSQSSRKSIIRCLGFGRSSTDYANAPGFPI
ncbi:TBP-associated factor 5 [Perilla frutescens var. frutescens]|nr:TBP-associated factor 5 [Perilla frutescens var. frutescens]